MAEHTARESAAYEEALAFAWREGFEGRDLPRGRRHSADGCPVSKAIGGMVASNVYRSRRTPEGEWRELPPGARRFLSLFDRGYFPELEERCR